MYGEEKLNHHYLLRYAFTKEFFEAFSALTYLNIELPLTLTRHFHIWIRPFVDAHLSNRKYINQLQRKHQLYTMSDIQKALQRISQPKRDVASVSHRKTIVMPAQFVSLALTQFARDDVILTVTNYHDINALKGKQLPNHITTFHLSQAMAKVQLPAPMRRNVQEIIHEQTSSLQHHELFGHADFKKWLEAYIFRMAKMVHALDQLIRKQPVGVILDHLEITVPGSVTSLLALKYNLPFINMPQVLVNDRSIIPTRAAYHYVWGKNYKEWLQKRGVPSSRIKVVGNIKFEYAQQGTVMRKSKFMKRLNIPPRHLVVTFTTQPFPEHVNHTIMRWIHSAAKSLPVTFIIRPHPSDQSDYTSFFDIPKKILLPSTLNLYNILTHTDFVMTISSNTAIEAALIRKGIIVVQPDLPYHYEHNNNEFNSHLANASAGIVVSNQNQFKKELQKLINNKHLRDVLYRKAQVFLKNTLTTTPSPSSEIQRLVHGLLNKRRG